MTDQAEEQEMEAEALQAIFDTHFTILGPQKWQVEIYPEMTADPDKLHELNHVGIKLIVDLPSDYPESAPPKLECEIIKGLVEEHRQELIGLANEEAAANEGVPSIFAVAERLREWLTENNQKGLDDLSMHAQMIRKQLAKEKEKKQAESTVWESQEAQEEFTAAELEEMLINKRRAEGTPCNKENFEAWKARFEAEMAEAENEEDNDNGKPGSKKMKKQGSTVDKSDRVTGFDYFRSKATNMEALEAAADAAENQEMDEEDDDDDDEDYEEENNRQLDVDEELFEDDVDLDDLDFDDDDDEEDVDI